MATNKRTKAKKAAAGVRATVDVESGKVSRSGGRRNNAARGKEPEKEASEHEPEDSDGEDEEEEGGEDEEPRDLNAHDFQAVASPDQDQVRDNGATEGKTVDQLKADLKRKDALILQMRMEQDAEEKRKKAAGKVRWERRSMAHLSKANQNALHRFVKYQLLPVLKFFPPTWFVYDQDEETLCGMLLMSYRDKDGDLRAPRLTPIEQGNDLEAFWYKDVVPALGYKMSQVKNHFLQKMRAAYKC